MVFCTEMTRLFNSDFIKGFLFFDSASVPALGKLIDDSFILPVAVRACRVN